MTGDLASIRTKQERGQPVAGPAVMTGRGREAQGEQQLVQRCHHVPIRECEAGAWLRRWELHRRAELPAEGLERQADASSQPVTWPGLLVRKLCVPFP